MLSITGAIFLFLYAQYRAVTEVKEVKIVLNYKNSVCNALILLVIIGVDSLANVMLKYG